MHRTTNHKSSANRIIKSIASPFCGRERGFSSFLFVLALLALGSIIIVPLLNYMITGTKAGSTYERKTTELYSADAGVEYAIFWLQHGLLAGEGFLNTENLTLEHSKGGKYHDGPLAVNNDNVTVTIENEKNESEVYRIVSTAIDNLTSSTTTVVSRVVPSIEFSGNFFNNALISKGNIDLKNANNEALVDGDIQVSGSVILGSKMEVMGNVVCDNMTNAGTIYGNVVCSDILINTGTITGDVWCGTLRNAGGVIDGKAECRWVDSVGDVGSGPFIVDPPPAVDLSDAWPDVGELDGYYNEGLTILGIPVSGGDMTVTGTRDLGPGKTGDFVPGEMPPNAATKVNLVIGAKNIDGDIRLTGTVLVTGDLSLNKGKLNLNGQTLYVRGEVYSNPGFECTGSGVIIALGDVTFQPNIVAGGTGDTSVILHYNGGSWTTNTGNIDTNFDLSRADLNDVWGIASNNVYAVGNGSTILHYYPLGGITKWYYKVTDPSLDLSEVLATPTNLNAIWGSSSDNVFVVGDAGTILHYDGVDNNGDGILWDPMTGGTTEDLRGIWGDPSVGVFVVGDQGTILYSPDGSTWEDISTGLTLEDLWDVHGIVDGSEVELFLVGAQGAILHSYGDFLDPDSWEKVPPPTAPTVMDLKGVWGFKDATSGATTFNVVGAAAGLYTKTSTILEYIDNNSDGTGTWSKESVGSGADLNDVWGIQSGGHTYVFAVGQDGVILRSFDGGAWTPMVNSSTRSLNGVWGLSPTDVFAAGQPKGDFIFVMSVYGMSTLLPGTAFFGTVAGASVVDLQPGSIIQAPMGTGDLNYPRVRWIRLETYVIK